MPSTHGDLGRLLCSNIGEWVDDALGTNYAQDFDLGFDLDSVHVDDVAPPIVKLSDAKRHASLLSRFFII